MSLFYKQNAAARFFVDQTNGKVYEVVGGSAALLCWRNGDFCYTMRVHLKVKGPKKPSRGTIRKDADYLRATCAGATAMKA